MIVVSTNTTNVMENVPKAIHLVEITAVNKMLYPRIILLADKVVSIRHLIHLITIDPVEGTVCIG